MLVTFAYSREHSDVYHPELLDQMVYAVTKALRAMLGVPRDLLKQWSHDGAKVSTKHSNSRSVPSLSVLLIVSAGHPSRVGGVS
jgi:hypothetical protein